MKSMKKFWSLLLVLAMFVSIFTNANFVITANADAKSNTVTVFYQNASWGKRTPNIHFKAGNGNWTAVPGVQMTKSSEQSGYDYKYTIELGSATQATVCFNDGNNNWDSRNGQNYTVGVGTYGIKDEKVKELVPVVTATPKVTPSATPKVTPSATPKVTPKVTPMPTPKDGDFYADLTVDYSHLAIGTTAHFKAKLHGFAGYNMYSTQQFKVYKRSTGELVTSQRAYTDNAGDFVYDWTPTAAGEYEVEFYVHEYDSRLITTSIVMQVYEKGGATAYRLEQPFVVTTSVEGDPNATNAYTKLGQAITINANTYGFSGYGMYSSHRWEVVRSSDGKVIESSSTGTQGGQYCPDKSSYTFTPKEYGEYWVRYYAHEYDYRKASAATKVYVSGEAENKANIYYENGNWDNVNIHYKVGNGNWTAGKGVAMSKTSTKTGYNWVYTIEMGAETEATMCFNNTTNSWDSQDGRNYKITEPGNYGIKNGKLVKLEPEKFSIADVKIDPKKSNTKVTTTVVNGKAPYTYSCEMKQLDGQNLGAYDKTYEKKSDNASEFQELGTYFGGNYKVVLTVTDADGNTATAEKKFYVEPLRLEIKTNVASPQKVGTAIEIDVDILNQFYYKFPNQLYLSVYNEKGEYQKLGTGDVWTPTEPGVYTIHASYKDSAPETAEAEIKYEIKPDVNNKVVVYYANNNWSNANIHYKVGNGNWTAGKGVAMTKDNTVDGYTWSYTIDLGEDTEATVCFNDTNSSWDSQNGRNYKVYTGNYGVKDGNVSAVEVSKEFKVSTYEVNACKGNTSVKVAIKNGRAPYLYTFEQEQLSGKYTRTYSPVRFSTYNDALTQTLTSYHGGKFKVTVTVVDADGQTATKTAYYDIPELSMNLTASSDNIKVGDTVTFDANIKDDYYYYSPQYCFFSVSKNGESFGGQATPSQSYKWTAKEAGTYEVKATFRDAAGAEVEQTIYVTVKEVTGNRVTVYYNTKWSKANIHFKVGNGSWTKVPGVAMTKTAEKSGYTYKYTIDLGDANNATICFNNGTEWDSRNGANYYVGTGVYGVITGQDARKLN